MALAPLPALSLSRTRKRRRRSGRESRERGGASRRAWRSATNASRDAGEVRRAYTGALAERLETRVGELHAPGRAWPERCGGAACRPSSRSSAERFLRQLDEAAFAASGVAAGGRGAARRATLSQGRWRGAAAHADRRSGLCIVVGLLAHRRRDGARVRYDRRPACVRSRASTAYERHDFVAAREAFIASVASRSVARRTRGRISARRRGPSPTPRAASPRGSVRFASSRSRPTCATASSSCTRSRGRPPATFRRFPRAWVFNLAALLWLGAWGTGRATTRRAIAGSPADAVRDARRGRGGDRDRRHSRSNERLSGRAPRQ